MTLSRHKLPIGIQTFAKIREADYYYVDKTAFALQLIESGSHYFLSRPRRFGKSLFLDTLKEMFEGNEKLFQGLYCHDQWDWQNSYPVIRISFAEGVLQSRAELEQRIRVILRTQREYLNLECSDESDNVGCFSELIARAHQQYGQRIVVLVDEYDKPILDNITKPEIAREMRDGLRNLYSVIKAQDAHIRFALLTGVSKFSKVSLFSGLNNLQDITVDKRYSAICGYTEQDVETVFAPELQSLEREKIRDWYNGYNWLGEAVYNPFDLLLLFDTGEFKAYWFETGTPTFLVKQLAKQGFFTPNLTRLRSSLEILSSFDVECITAEALLFQTGYLTIHKAEQPILGHWVYTLGYPNHEVESSLNASLLSVYTDDISKSFANRMRLLDLLQANEIAGLENLFQSFFAGIPHHWYVNNDISRYEGYYASVFYSYFAALGVTVIPEDITHHGRIDMTVQFNQRIYLFEFKVVESTPTGSALQQLKEKRYADKYHAEGLPIYLIGVEFSREQRTVVGFEVEVVDDFVE